MKLREKLIDMGKSQFFDVFLPQIERYINKSEVEAFITGSVSFGYCDKYSGVDGTIFLSQRDYEEYGEILK